MSYEGNSSPEPSGNAPPLPTNSAIFEREELVDALEEVLRRLGSDNSTGKKSPGPRSLRRKPKVDADLEREKQGLGTEHRLEFLVRTYHIVIKTRLTMFCNSTTFAICSQMYSTFNRTTSLHCIIRLP
jgi:hypothetical protein